MQPSSRTSSASLVSVGAGLFVLASIGLLWPPMVTMCLSVLAVVSGHIARAAIRREPELVDGGAMAVARLLIGYLGLLAGLVAVVLLGAGFMYFGGR